MRPSDTPRTGSPARPEPAGLGAAVARFLHNRGAVAAVEFAVVLPVLLFGYMGTYEAARALDAYRKVGSTAETVGNLVTRLRSIDTVALGNIFDISGAVMAPFPTANELTITVTAVRVDAQGKGTVHWSRANRGAALGAGAAYTLPADLSTFKDSYFVVTTTRYAYHGSIDFGGLIKDFDMSETYAFRPRKSLEIAWTP